MALVNDRDLRAATEERVVTIREVNLSTSTLVGEDIFGQRIQASLNLTGQIIAIPSVGEKWTFARQGNLWYPSKNQSQTLDDLVPGDKKLSTGGTLYLIGNAGVVINGYDWNTTLDAINTDIEIALTSAIIKQPELSTRNVIQPTIGGATALTLKGNGSQSVPLLNITDSADGNLANVSHQGRLTSQSIRLDNLYSATTALSIGGLGEIQVDYPSVVGGRMVLDNNGQLRLPRQGSTAGIVLGGDANLYRGNTNLLKTDDSLLVENGVWTGAATVNDIALGIYVTGDTTNDRFDILGSGKLLWGAGNAFATDTNLYRSTTATLKTDSNFVVQGATTLTGAATAPTVAALNNSTSIATTAYVISNAATASPLTDQTSAVVGTSNRYAREDHRHPLTTQLNTLNNYNTNGLLTQTSAGTFTGRTITGTSGQIDVANGNGVSGNPTLTLPSTITQATTFSATLTAGATGKTAITISDNGTQTSGLTIGGNTNLYRASGVSILQTDNIFSTTVGGARAFMGNAYDVSNNYIGGYFSASLRWDGTNWQNETVSGNNGWYMWAGRAGAGGADLFTDSATGASNRTYTPAQMQAKRVVSVLSDGRVGLGIDTPLRRLSFPNDVAEKISLYSQSATARDYYGFAIEGGTQAYQVPSGGNHTFYRGSTVQFQMDSSGANKSNGMRVHRHPYANERHMESGLVSFLNVSNDSGFSSGITFTDAYASAPVITTSYNSISQALGNAYREITTLADDISTTGATIWAFGNSYVSSFDSSVGWIAEGAD